MLFKDVLVPISRPKLRPKALQVSVHDLAIKWTKVMGLQPFDQMNQRHFGGIRRGGKHALTEEHPADGNAVQPTHQLFLSPDFDRVGHAQRVECEVRLDHVV